MNTTTIQTRLSPKLKKDAQKAFKSMGLDLSTGVKLFLTQVVRTQSIPFEMFTFDNLSEEKKLEIVREVEYEMKHGKTYANIHEMHEEILREE